MKFDVKIDLGSGVEVVPESIRTQYIVTGLFTHVCSPPFYIVHPGDLMGSTMNDLGGLVKKPYGCGEQNMINFVPALDVLMYLNATGQSSSNIAQRAKRFATEGFLVVISLVWFVHACMYVCRLST